MCENRIELLDLILGATWIGAIAVPLNTALRGEQLAHQLRNSGARVLAMDSALVEILAHVEGIDELEQVWALDGVPAEIPANLRATVGELPPAADAVAAGDVGPGDTGAILYTSGTTGPSKGVCCPHAQFYWWGVLVGEMLELGEDDVLYTVLPLFHTNALNAFVQALVAGATYELGPRFSASRFWDAGRRLGRDGDVPARRDGERSSCRAPTARRTARTPCATALAPGDAGGAVRPLPRALRRRSSSRATARRRRTARSARAGAGSAPGWMGRVRTGFDARVVDEHDAEVAARRAGRARAARRPPVRVRDRLLRHAGEDRRDLAQPLVPHRRPRRARRGRLVRGSWTASRTRSAAAARTSRPSRSSTRCSSTPPSRRSRSSRSRRSWPRTRSRPPSSCATVAAAEPVELIRHCEPRLAYFAIPRYVQFVEALPLTENGKVRKAVLRDAGVTDDMWDREAAGVTIRRLGR